MRILAIDPGNVQSAWVAYDTRSREVFSMGLEPNADVLWSAHDGEDCDRIVIEMIACYGMAVGHTVFETCVWIGRFIESWEGRLTARPRPKADLLFRRDVKLELCGQTRAKDANVRMALIDRFGGSKRAAVGVKAAPGPLYGIRKDIWAALGVAIAYAEMTKGGQRDPRIIRSGDSGTGRTASNGARVSEYG